MSVSKVPGPRTLFATKGSQEWFDWLRRYADFAGVSITVAIDLAIKAQARRDGFPEPMPKRTAMSRRGES